VDIDAKDPAQSLTETQKEVGDGVFSVRNTPVRLSVKVRQLPAWRAEDGSANPVPQSPVTSDQPIENATLVPYAAAKLRITAFPHLTSVR
jgi:hypothetical protein